MVAHQRKGLGRPVVLLDAPHLLDPLAERFEVFSFEPANAEDLRATLEQLRIERPLIIALGPVDTLLALVLRRPPRGIVAREPLALTWPVLAVGDATDPRALAELIANFDAPLDALNS